MNEFVRQYMFGHQRDTSPLLCQLAAIALTMMTANAMCERGFSMMKLIKTDKRNRMGTETLDTLLRLAMCETDVENMDFTDAITRWTTSHKRAHVTGVDVH